MTRDEIKNITIISFATLFLISLAFNILYQDIIEDKNELIKKQDQEIKELEEKAESFINAFYSCNDILIEEELVNE